MKDLEFIRSVVKLWPDNAESVRLDKDGEICFIMMDDEQSTDNDFYPKDKAAAKAAFCGNSAVGRYYTKEQWQGESK